MILLKQLPIHPRPVVKAFKVRLGGELDQIAVARLVFRQQHKVVTLITVIMTEAAILGNIHLATNNRLDAGFFGCLVELDSAIHDTMVGYRQAVHPQLFGPCHQLGDTAHAIQQTILGVDVKMSEHSTF